VYAVFRNVASVLYAVVMRVQFVYARYRSQVTDTGSLFVVTGNKNLSQNAG
jgi:hypothetical protein